MKLHSSLILFMVLCWAKGAAAGLPSDIFGLGPLQRGLSSYCMAATGLSRTIASAQRRADWGYAALLIDSFGRRGFQEVCNRGLLVPPEAHQIRAGRRDRSSSAARALVSEPHRAIWRNGPPG
ncbi:MAG: hypothetical protein J2P48_03800 [Alphaproteobacteria bacterium]|nr:hypothetical protein [Alphaproteobacteria bacterium]